MGGSQSVENFRAMTTPGYQPKAPKPKAPRTQLTGVAALGMTDLSRTAADPAYRPKVESAMSSGQRVVAIDQRFCSASSVTLHLREKFFSLSGDSFSIRDVSTGAVWFRVAGKALSIREKKTLLDARGTPVASMKEVFFSLMPSYHVSSTSGASLFEIHCKFSVFSTDLRVEFTNKATKQRCKMGLSGDWVHRKATIWLETSGARRETVGRVYRPLTAARNIVLGTQDYYLEIAPNVDMALMVLICAVLDEKASD
ncbi:hypothetical protein Gpo141_00008544 [Globisporangium polare]